MKFIVDECVGPKLASWLKGLGYDVISVYDEMPGKNDEAILTRACADKRILITNDKDFGEMVFRQQKNHHGVILLRVFNEHPLNKIAVMKKVLDYHAVELYGNFVVASEKSIRITRLKMVFA